MTAHLHAGWRKVATRRSGRFVHVFLPEDPLEAHDALLGLAGPHTRMGHVYDHGRMADLVANEGFSHNPLHGAAPSTGYMASYHAPEESGLAQVHHISQITPEHIAQHRLAADEHLRDPHTFQGGWHDTATGDVYLDVSKHHDDLHAARDFGAEQKQKAIFHLGDFSEHFLHPKQDPLAVKDPEAWHERYAETGTEPHPRFHEYAHLYPFTDDQKEHFASQGEHVGSRMAGRPVGPWRSDRWVDRQLHGEL